jgi:hypothetical protein
MINVHILLVNDDISTKVNKKNNILIFFNFNNIIIEMFVF